MKPVRLSPVRRDPPVCEAWDDLQAVLRFERSVRVHRAYSETFDVTPLEDVVDGTYRVRGESGAEYLADLVDGSGDHDACTCPDFLANGLGTCKHIEAVRRAVVEDAAAARALRDLPASPRVPTVTVDAVDGLALSLGGRWNDRLASAHGLARDPRTGEVEVRAGSRLRPGRSLAGARIVHAAVPAADRIARSRAVALRRREFVAAAERGAVGVDVLSGPLFPYQRAGVLHLAAAGRAMLADDMGLGKTVQAIAACEVLRARGEASRVLVVAPTSLKHQWAAEIERFTGSRAVVVGGAQSSRSEAFDSDAPYKILSYEMTWRELTRLKALDADILVLDEAQRARNFRTRTAATLRAIPSRFLFVLTGTPIENRLDDLYSLLQIVDPEILGPLWRFNFQFHRQEGPRGRVVGCKNLSDLRERLAGSVLRRRKDEVLTQLPPLTEQTRYCPLTEAQREVEEGCRGEAARLLAAGAKRSLSPSEQRALQALLTKARQACDALELADPSRGAPASPKLDEFEAVVSEIAAQGTSKVLVFSEWTGMLELAAKRLDGLGIGHATLHGGVPSDDRPALIERFRGDPDLRVLLSTDAGGVGLNLQVASYVIHLDLPWNPARLDQRTARAHRLGQNRGVTVTYLCAETGIERAIEGTLAAKRAVRSAALDADSDVDTLDGAGFQVLARELGDVLARADGRPAAAPRPRAQELDLAPAARGAGDRPGPGAADSRVDADAPEGAATGGRPAAGPGAGTADGGGAGSAGDAGAAGPIGAASVRARDRLRLARLVLDGGFPADAVRAAYEALAAAVAGLADGAPPAGHTALVAAMYRDLVPSGRLPSHVPAVLARLNDLSVLESQGVALDASLAADAVAEAESWVARILPTRIHRLHRDSSADGS